MHKVEYEFIKSVDDVVLSASGKTLKKLQQIDIKTQLGAITFYDAYIESQKSNQKIKTSSKPSVVPKRK